MYHVHLCQLYAPHSALVHSRCGPFPDALEALMDPRMRALVNSMVSVECPLQQGLEGIRQASTKGVLKVQLVCEAAPAADS
jgi:hypothetical protein